MKSAAPLTHEGAAAPLLSREERRIDLTTRGADEVVWLTAIKEAGLLRWKPGPPGTVIVVSPHPDDETLALGGVLYDLAETGFRIRVASVTDGEAAYPDAAELGVVRRGELAAALHALGSPRAITALRLGLSDGDVAGCQPLLESLLAPLVRAAAWVLAPWPADGHPDHEAAGRAAQNVARACGTPIRFFPVWAWHWARPDAGAGARLLTGAERWELSPATRAAKARALEAFASQRDGALGPPILAPHVVERFLRPFELLLRA